jgi:hypothetical protein
MIYCRFVLFIMIMIMLLICLKSKNALLYVVNFYLFIFFLVDLFLLLMTCFYVANLRIFSYMVQ